ncbi:hypothetical protein HAX54_041926 [Datura stramonium]|uniref:Uncharacterized protein n=1 Tax=Datura stramonium TaxID=4076 RepID=A0ABS8RNP9_DATST|nr:hypothetical protein [Datura stramonium]
MKIIEGGNEQQILLRSYFIRAKSKEIFDWAPRRRPPDRPPRGKEKNIRPEQKKDKKDEDSPFELLIKAQTHKTLETVDHPKLEKKKLKIVEGEHGGKTKQNSIFTGSIWG